MAKARDALDLHEELKVCRDILDKMLEECQGAEDPDAELVTRARTISGMVQQINKVVYAIVKVEKMRNQQLSKTDVLALASKIGDIAHKYMPEKKVAAFLDEVSTLSDSHEAT